MTNTKESSIDSWDKQKVLKQNSGWVLSNNEKGESVIQKDDESPRFLTDDEATEFVVKSYDELLQACKRVIACIGSNCEPLGQGGTEGINNILQQAINKAESK